MCLNDSIEILENYVVKNNFKGYDPYDTLNSVIPFRKFGKWLPVLVTQFQKRNPFNIRPLLGIQKEINPKAYGLFLNAFSKQYELTGTRKYLQNCKNMADWLIQNTAPGYGNMCWGYHFDWASPLKTVPAYSPSVVSTAFVVKGLFQYYRLFQSEEVKSAILSAARYVYDDLPKYKNKYGTCISYTDIQVDVCYNANLLGAEILGYAYTITGNTEYRKLAKSALDFTIHYQHEDGHWNYSLNPETGRERKQVDFHQGYILESAFEIIKHCGFGNEYDQYIKKGLEFYINRQFYTNGRSLWRLPRKWPVDIHNQSQGMITFVKLKEFGPSYADFASVIADWTIKNMQDEKGFFYYQKHRFYRIKIPYMRWAQAWMYLALTDVLYYK